MRKKAPFNKKVLAILIEKGKGNRSTRQFAADAGVSYVQLHKLEHGMQENAPGRKLLTKLAEVSENGLEAEDYLFVCGRLPAENKPQKARKKKSLDVQTMFDALSKSQQKTVYDFMDYLCNYKQ